MKIAIASDDKKTISHHFGRALGFVVYDIQNVIGCEIVISYGMGQRIYDDLTNANINPIVTEESTVDEALTQFLKHQLINRTDKLH
ncbi:MAG: NifB/NifX family molybdenum-iron cluster-binding protein [archaeon]